MKKVLIANRGEIARRIQATCQAIGIKTIAIYSKEDLFSSYVYHADEAYELSENGYLDRAAIIEIAARHNASAIHPGYGFLSEDAAFAQMVIDAGITWIGPTPKNIALLADKSQAQHIMKQSGVNTIPGKTIDADDPNAPNTAKHFASLIGFPVLLKCAHGGGGKGMRLVKHLDEFEHAWNLVTSESKRLFNSNTIIVEKQIVNPRHIEVQIASHGGHHIHLFERECSLQRRHQKIIEESPCNFISQIAKQKLYNAALKAAKAVDYENVGTVEFLVDQNENFYFLEMNTRLQVEHSVTELTTGIDLVALQIKIAQNKNVLPAQQNVSQLGHAIECRIYAEDPSQNFMPSTGKIKNLILPNNPFLRIDHDLEEGMEITPHFDPMLLKFTTRGFSRNEAIAHMIASLKRTNIFGIKTNISFLTHMLTSNEFIEGNIHTQSLQNVKIEQKKDASDDNPNYKEMEQTVQILNKKLSPAKKDRPATSQVSNWRKKSWK